MKKTIKPRLEMGTAKVRVYPSDYQKLLRKAHERRTTMAQIIHEMLEQ